jgi:hypothetical protein
MGGGVLGNVCAESWETGCLRWEFGFDDIGWNRVSLLI